MRPFKIGEQDDKRMNNIDTGRMNRFKDGFGHIYCRKSYPKVDLHCTEILLHKVSKINRHGSRRWIMIRNKLFAKREFRDSRPVRYFCGEDVSTMEKFPDLGYRGVVFRRNN